ncbi:Ctr copper transporter family-domain-containing protein [Morchella snyderi]|nr:Ctr copper transporter family-domain-containing protein [Morchella snyderi]
MDHIMPEQDMSGHDMMASNYRCQMSMLFTWNTENLCLVFRWWHVSSTFTLILSLLGVVVLSAGYEFVREISRRYEGRVDAENASLSTSGRNIASASKRGHIGKAIFYGIQVFYSFFIMLLFMTYNGWVMIAVAVGASLGYTIWGGASATKSVACH